MAKAPRLRETYPNAVEAARILRTISAHRNHVLFTVSMDSDFPVSLPGHPAGERLGFEAARLSVDLFYRRQTGHPEIRIIPSHLHTRTSTDVFAVDDPSVAKAQRWIRENLGDAADVNDVVAAMGISRRNLEEKFRQNLRRGIASELLQARITRATELLGSTTLSISEIAQLVGFSESRLLSRNFRKITGETPGQYRSRIKPL